MGAVATFDPVAFVARYPEFSTVAAATLTAYALEATLYFRNDGGGPVADPVQQLLILNMVTAHIAAINSGVNGQAPSPINGNLTSASEGSVSVGVTNNYPPGTVQWWQQTKYGAAFWAATSVYRRFQYRAPIARPADPWRGNW